MSRSKKKTPKFGNTTSETEKDDKRKANRKFRHITKIQVRKGDENFAAINDISNVWLFAKDGKTYIKNPPKKYLRK